MGMFAPELVVYTAWRQWHEAKKLTAEMNELFDREVRNDKCTSYTISANII
jgi:hypothetical protein